MRRFLFILTAIIIVSTIVITGCAGSSPTISSTPSNTTSKSTSNPTTATSPATSVSTSQSVKPIELSMAGFMPLTDVNMTYANEWASEIEKKSQGRVKINRFWAQTLTKAEDTYSAVRTGVVDIGLSAQSYQSSDQFRLSVGIGLPFGFKSNEACGRCFRDLYDKIPAFKNEYKEVKNLFIWVPGLFQIHTIKKEVLVPDDMKGLQIRSPGGVVTNIIQAWGGTAVSMPMSEAYISLQKGIVDGILAPYQVAKDNKIGELTKYANEGNYCTNPFLFIMNKSKYQSLPQDIQKIIDDTSYEWWITAGKHNDELDPGYKQWCVSQGIKIYVPQGDQEALWKQKNKSIIDNWAKGLAANGLPDAVTFVDEAYKIAQQ